MDNNWMVQVPIKELLALCGLKDELDKVNIDNIQLRREIEGLRATLYQAMEILGECRKELKHREA